MGQSLKSNIAAALGLELHHPMMSNLWGLRDQNYRHTYRDLINVDVLAGVPHLGNSSHQILTVRTKF